MKEALRIFICPVEDCPKIGPKSSRCPDHNLIFRGTIYRKIAVEKETPTASKDPLGAVAFLLGRFFSPKK